MTTAFLPITAHKHIPRILGIGLFLQQLDAMILNTAIPQMSLALATPPLTLKLAITSYLLTLAMFIPISGYMADRFGTQRVFAAAMGIFLLGSLICGFSGNVDVLIIGRLIQGFGAAMVTPVGRLVLLKTFSRADFLTAFMYYTLIGQLGLVMGPVLGGVLTTFVSWRFIFFVNIPVVLFALYCVYRFIPNHMEDQVPRFDWLGFVVFGAAAGCITYGLSLLTEESFSDLHRPVIILVVGLVLLGVYVLHALRTTHPSLDIKLFRFIGFRAATLGGFVLRLMLGGFGFLVPLELQLLMGYSAFESGLIILPNALTFFASKVMVKKLLSRFGFKPCLLVAPLCVACFLFALAWIRESTPVWVIILIMLPMGFASSMQYSFLNSLNFADIPTKDTSQATGVSTVFQQLGLSFAVCLCAGLLVSSSHLAHQQVLGYLSFHVTFLVLSALTVLCTLLFVRLPKDIGQNLLKAK